MNDSFSLSLNGKKKRSVSDKVDRFARTRARNARTTEARGKGKSKGKGKGKGRTRYDACA